MTDDNPTSPRRARRSSILVRTPGTFNTVTTPPGPTPAPGASLPPPQPLEPTGEAAPLLLLPLRLEYRVIERRSPPAISDSFGELRGMLNARPGGRQDANRAAVKELRTQAVRPRLAAATVEKEIWFRWYPDDGFAEKGVPPADEFEQTALQAFNRELAGRRWLDVSTAQAHAAWQSLASAVGPERAIHLLRSQNTAAANTGDPQRLGRIAALPARVVLFAVTDRGNATLLVEGRPVPKDTQPERIAYTPKALDPGSWLNSFEAAVQAGMGVKIDDPSRVNAALAASWIVAVGLHSGNALSEIETLLKDAIANGNFAILPQDTPTNRSTESPNPAIDPRSDMAGFLQLASQDERGQASGVETAASLLASALGINPAVTRQAVNAADPAFADARAMLRVVGPALLDAAFEGEAGLEIFNENEFINVIAGVVSANGVLPALRFGRNPFGLLPVTRLSDLQVEGAGGLSTRVQGFLLNYSRQLRDVLAPLADQIAPVISPGDPQAAEKLDEILKVYPVSRRVDVGNTGAERVEALGCGYISGRKIYPTSYLADLRLKPLKDLPDPDEADRSWPLLYRLARLSLVSITLLRQINSETAGANTKLHSLEKLDDNQRAALLAHPVLKIPLSELSKPAASSRIPGVARFARLYPVAVEFTAALTHLEQIAKQPNGVARLETLLLATIDLFQHRVDAWAAGLAYARLARRRSQGHNGLYAGYYGLLGKLHPNSTTGTSDGYLQAPSQAQAVTAALLRSAHLRHSAGGAFNIQLPSSRVRRAMTLLEMLQRGLSLPETLGYRGERWLHDQHADILIARLRGLFQLRNLTSSEGRPGVSTRPVEVNIRLFDGLAFVHAQLNQRALQDQLPTARALQRALADDLDALSDLILCETIYQSVLGQSEVANAWLQVLSGGPVPGEPEFVRTQRHGQGSSHRVILLIPPAAPPTQPVPREIAEPALAAFAARLLPRFAQAKIPVTIERLPDKTPKLTIDVSIQGDLGMRPIDLLVGGESELRLRLRNHAITRWLTDAAVSQVLGALPTISLEAFLNREAVFQMDLSGGPVDVATLLQRAAQLRSFFQQARPLAPGDLNAAASPANPLTETAEVALLVSTGTGLSQRVKNLLKQLDQDQQALETASAAFLTAARETRRRMDIQAPDPEVSQALRATDTARGILTTALLAVSRYSEPEALRVLSTPESAANPTAVDEYLAALISRLSTRRVRLDEALANTECSAPTALAQARCVVRQLTTALQAALDGEALPVLPPVPRLSVTTPLLERPKRVEQALGEWAPRRAAVARALSVASMANNLAAFLVAEAATDDENPNARDQRNVEEAPRSLHFGVLIGDRNTMAAQSEWIGVVADEWVEQRPSRSQMASLALNYDSPQSEPPHCLLLCVPPNPSYVNWTERRAVEMVIETIQWMKIRALSSEQKPTTAALFPRANQVPEIRDGTRRRNRLPTNRYPFMELVLEGRLFVAADPAAPVKGAKGMGLNEIGGFHQVEE